MNSLTYQNNILLNKLLIFYEIDSNKEKFLNIINGKENISLRLIDWFVTNYCKNKHIIYNLNDKNFNIFQNYKLMLKSFKKKKFDPFCRSDRILLNFNNQTFETTVGQLNFFKWAIQNNIIEYIKLNKEDIEKDMNNNKKIKDNKNKLIINAEKKETDNNVELILSFN